MTERYILFPCIGNTGAINKLKDYWFWVVLLEDKIILGFKEGGDVGAKPYHHVGLTAFTGRVMSMGLTFGDEPLLRLKNNSRREKARWSGDLLTLGKTKILALDKVLVISGVKETDKIYKNKFFKVVKQNDNILLVPKNQKGSLKKYGVVSKYITYSEKWINKAPKKNTSLVSKELWEHVWALHRVNQYEPEGLFKKVWESPSRYAFYQRAMFAMWDSFHIAEDLMYYDVKLAQGMMENHYRMMDKDGMIPQDCFPEPKDLLTCGGGYGDWFYNYRMKSRIKGSEFEYSQPPLWSMPTFEIYKRSKDKKFLEESYLCCKKNIEWWEKNRQDEKTGLLFIKHTYEEGTDNSALYSDYDDTQIIKASEFASVTFSAIMTKYYEDMAEMADELGDRVSMYNYGMKSEKLREDAQQLWDEEKKTFNIKNFKTGEFRRMYMFLHIVFSLYGGIATRTQAKAMVKHLFDKNMFWTKIPFSFIALKGNEKLDRNKEVLISMNLWLLKGLKRYGMHKEAKYITEVLLTRIESIFENEKAVYESYEANEGSMIKYTRKGHWPGAHPLYIGHMPLHAIANLGFKK